MFSPTFIKRSDCMLKMVQCLNGQHLSYNNPKVYFVEDTLYLNWSNCLVIKRSKCARFIEMYFITTTGHISIVSHCMIIQLFFQAFVYLYPLCTPSQDPICIILQACTNVRRRHLKAMLTTPILNQRSSREKLPIRNA